MAKGGFVVNWDGRQQRCYDVRLDFDKHTFTECAGETCVQHVVKDWSTFSVHAITKKDVEETLGEVKIEEVKEEVKKDET